MKQLRLAAALILALAVMPLAACAQVTALAGGVTSAIPAVGAVCKNTVVDEQGWARALQGYVRLNASYLVALKTDSVPKAVVAKVRPIRLQAPLVREAGNAALRACNATNLGAQITALSDLASQFRRAAPTIAR